MKQEFRAGFACSIFSLTIKIVTQIYQEENGIKMYIKNVTRREIIHPYTQSVLST